MDIYSKTNYNHKKIIYILPYFEEYNVAVIKLCNDTNTIEHGTLK